MTKSKFPALAFSAALTLSIVLAACSFSLNRSGNWDTASSESSSSSSFSSAEDPGFTPNVSFTGILTNAKDSTVAQGTHILTLDDGQIIVLRSSDAGLDLDRYIEKHVEARGSVQPALEGGGTIMSVAEITVLESSSSSTSSVASSESSALSSSEASAMTKRMCGGFAAIACPSGEVCIDDPSDSCDPANGGADCAGMCVTVLKSSSPAPSSASSIRSSSTAPVSSSAASVVSSEPPVGVENGALEEQIKLMAKQAYDQPSLWTQKYCTSHIAFCIPVHKNWYFKSFGATTSNSWHVEFGMASIDELNQGAIILNLVSGTSASASATSGQVKTQGADVIGYKDWQDGTHFELIADARLRAAVEFMLSSITAYELSQ